MGGEAEEEWMDVDGEEAPGLKKARTNSGAVVAKGARHPRSNRQLAGMRDEAVSSPSVVYNIPIADQSSVLSKHQKQSSCAISASENATCTHGRERATARSKSKWSVARRVRVAFPSSLTGALAAQASIRRKAEDGQDGPSMMDRVSHVFLHHVSSRIVALLVFGIIHTMDSAASFTSRVARWGAHRA